MKFSIFVSAVIAMQIIISCTTEPNAAKDENNAKPVLYERCTYENPMWQKRDDYAYMLKDTSAAFSGKTCLYLDGYEFGPTFMTRLGNISNKMPAKLSASVYSNFIDEPDSSVQLVLSVNNASNTKLWISSKMYSKEAKKGEWFQTTLNVSLPLDFLPEDTMKLYIWNPTKKKLLADDMDVKFF